MTHVEHKHIFRLKNKFILHSWIKFKRKVWNECKIGHKIVSIKIEWLAMPAYNSFNFIRWHLPVQPCHSPVVSSYVPSLPITKYSDLSLVCSQFSVLCKSTDGQSLSPPVLLITPLLAQFREQNIEEFLVFVFVDRWNLQSCKETSLKWMILKNQFLEPPWISCYL